MTFSIPGPRVALAALLTLLATLGAASVAHANHSQPARDISKLPYQPIGHFAHGDDIPEPNEAIAYFSPLMTGLRFNPSGTYNAYDTNVFETLMLPFRAAGDDTTNDPYGNGMTTGDPRHGYCEQDPEYPDKRPGNTTLLSGVCPNHALEYAAYYEETMQDILGKFGVTLKRYPITVGAPSLPGIDNTLGGEAYNLAAVVPGADHPDESIVVGAHYDQTNDGPASTWDSAEGHAQVIRMAKQMADYWEATGTRPSATVKFIPWAGEEAGTLGSLDYVEDNVVPGEEGKVRGYWNTDPCAGGYPAFRYGNPNDRIKLGIQLARPTEVPDEFAELRPRVTAFNDIATQVVEDVFTKLDDTVPVNPTGTREVFISTSESAANTDVGTNVTIGSSRPVLFSSDWQNFLGKGIPFFNPGPEVTGPSDENETNYPDGAATFHTPRDNQVTMNQFTGQALSIGNDAVASEAWAKGMEMCASLLSWGMLREDQGGAQTTDTEPVAYYEALPNEAIARGPVTFDAAGSYQYLDKDARTYVPDGDLEFTWEFGDGSTGTGQTVEHSYAVAGEYTSKLTVRNTATNATDTMSVPITVVGATLNGPELTAPADDEDGNFDIAWEFDEAAREGLQRYLVEEATDVRRAFTDPAETLDNWTSSEPTAPEVTPWKVSDDSDSPRGNEHHGGEHSFYTGVPRSEHQSGVGPNAGISKLTLKQSFQLAKDAELSFWSSFVNDLNDVGLVEVAIDDGSPDDELDWEVLHREVTGDDDNLYNVPNDEAGYPTEFKHRRVDLGRFAGQKVKLRFVYQLGAAQYVNVARAGWYVDDLQVDTGTFTEVGQPTAKTLSIGPRRRGTYAYRVRAIYADTATLPSNYAVTNVTVGTEPGGATPQTPVVSPPAATCTVTNGFTSVRVRPRRRGLRFTFARAVQNAARVDVYRYRKGKSRRLARRAIVRFQNRTRSFTWRGRGKRVRNGVYYARLSVRLPSGVWDRRYVALSRSKGRFKVRKTFVRRANCGPLRRFQLRRRAFSAKARDRIRVLFEIAEPGTAEILLLRRNRIVRRQAPRQLEAAGVYRAAFSGKRLRKGEYRVRIIAVVGGRRVVSTLGARRL